MNGESTSQSKQRNLTTPQGIVLNVIIFLVVINSILEEMGNEVDRSFFADDITIYILQQESKGRN